VISRRRFLAGAGGAAGLATMSGVLSRLALSQPVRPPTRLLIIHKPVGTIPEHYECTGGERDFVLSPILAPFAGLRSHLTIVDGLDILKKDNTPGEDHGNAMITFMTGGVSYKPDASNVVTAERASIDHVLSLRDDVTGDAPIRSLQLAADVRTHQLMARTLTYAGRGAAMPPEQRPFAAYARVFGGLADGALSPDELARARARKQSVLDFARGGLDRLAPRLGAAERIRLERHLDAVRELERVMDRTLGVDTTWLERRANAIDPTDNDQHADIGRLHLDIIRTAFECDLTRVATFAWAAGTTHVNLSRLIPGTEDVDHHTISHGGDGSAADQAAIHRWYNERTADFVQTLHDTPDDAGGSLLDNTLVVMFSEMRLGSHTFDGIPLVLLGGAGGRLAGGRRLVYDHRPTNDLWLAIANALGDPMACFGDPERCTGPLPGLF
jgi:hypothetical protein